jgi:hypothetical protein
MPCPAIKWWFNMVEGDALGIYLPAELLDGFKKLMEVGLDKVKISQAERENLSAWWAVEKELLSDEARLV